MNPYNMDRIRLNLVKRLDPDALDRPLMKLLTEHQERIANDPVIQEQRAVATRETRRQLLPWIAGGTLLQWAAWGALHAYLPGLVAGDAAVRGAIATTALSIALFASILRIDG